MAKTKSQDQIKGSFQLTQQKRQQNGLSNCLPIRHWSRQAVRPSVSTSVLRLLYLLNFSGLSENGERPVESQASVANQQQS